MINLSTEKTQTCCSYNRFPKQKHLTEPYLALIIIQVNNKISVATICHYSPLRVTICHYSPLFATIRHHLPLFATTRDHSHYSLIRNYSLYSLMIRVFQIPDIWWLLYYEVAFWWYLRFRLQIYFLSISVVSFTFQIVQSTKTVFMANTAWSNNEWSKHNVSVGTD